MKEEDRSIFDMEPVTPTKSTPYGNSEDQVIDFYLPANIAKPLVVLIHGGYWRSEYDRRHCTPLASNIAKDGWPVALIEYRRIIGNPDAMISDVLTAVEVVKKEFSKIILLGHSAGGHLALLVANQTSAVGVIALAPVTDLLRAEELDLDEGAVSDFLGCPAEIRRDLDPMRCNQPKMKTVLIHGALDMRVPIQFSRDYLFLKQLNDLDLLEVANLGHFELIDPRQEVYQVLKTALSQIN
jgi:acetyl esterase/lipase